MKLNFTRYILFNMLLLMFVVLVLPLSVLATPHDNHPSFSKHETRFSLNNNQFTASDDIIFKKAYYSINGTPWQTFNLTTQDNTYNNWILTSATKSLPTTFNQPGDYYIAAYTCTLTSNSWDCHDNKWQLLDFTINEENEETNQSLEPTTNVTGERICALNLNSCKLSSENDQVVTQNWFTDLMDYIRDTNILGEYLYNEVWYKMDTEGNPIMHHECSCTANDFNVSNVESRTLTRYMATKDNWGWYGVDGARDNPFQATEHYISLTADDDPLVIYLNDLHPSLYSFYIYGTIAQNGRDELTQIWKPAPMEFRVYNEQDEVIENGLLLLKQGFNPRRMQGFHFQPTQQGNYRVEFNLHHTAQETAEIMWIRFFDHMYLIPNQSIKTSQNIEIGTSPTDVPLTQDRLDRDDKIWHNYVNFNRHTGIDNHGITMLSSSPTNGGDWDIYDWRDTVYYYYGKPENVFPSLSLYDAGSNDIITHEEILNFSALPNPNYPDYGACYYHDNEYNCQVASALGKIYLQYYASIVNTDGGYWDGEFDDLCLEGNMDRCHDGALGLVRMAFDWPAIEMILRDVSYSTHVPDLAYNTDWSTHTRRNGKFFYSGWSGANTHRLLTAYDHFYPYISTSQSLADSINRYVSWVETPDDVVRLLDRYLVFSSIRDYDRSIIRTNSVPAYSYQVLGLHPYTYFLLDFSVLEDEIYPVSGTIQELYAKALYRAGPHYIGSASYAAGKTEDIISKAKTTQDAKAEGYVPIIDFTDVDYYSKIKSSIYFLTNMYVAGGYRLTYGDASGGPHASMRSLSQASTYCSTYQNVYDIYSSPLAAWALTYACDETDPTIISRGESIADPITEAESRIIPSTSAILELGSNELSYMDKHAVTMKLGVGRGHAHNDFLDLNIFSLGLPMAVDLGQRNEGDLWTRPDAGWSYLHNHAFAHKLEEGSNNPRSAQQYGEPWIVSFSPQSMRGKYYDLQDQFSLDRQVFAMDVDGTKDMYVFDIQRVQGGDYHTWNFHGAETHELQMNIPMTSSVVRWTDRLLENTQRQGIAIDSLEAVWEMSRESRSYAHSFDGGGTITTKETEQTVLGSDYDGSKPTAKIKATLLGRGGDTVMDGFAYSEYYDYAFPFLFVQDETPIGTSIYPALYESYRETPVIASTQVHSLDPLNITVTTTAGQIDNYYSDGMRTNVVSKDSSGNVRFVNIQNETTIDVEGVYLQPFLPSKSATIIDIDYDTKTITLDQEMPANPLVVIENPQRSIDLQLYGGRGTTFRYDDHLLVSYGTITSYSNLDDGSIVIDTTQGPTDNGFVLFTHHDERKRSPDGFTYTNEDHTVAFRDKTLVTGQTSISENLFTDTNGDGLIALSAYDIGLGETVKMASDVTIKRIDGSYHIKTNVPVSGTIEGTAINVIENYYWQSI